MDSKKVKKITHKQVKEEMKKNGYGKPPLKERSPALEELRKFLIKKGIISK